MSKFFDPGYMYWNTLSRKRYTACPEVNPLPSYALCMDYEHQITNMKYIMKNKWMNVTGRKLLLALVVCIAAPWSVNIASADDTSVLAEDYRNTLNGFVELTEHLYDATGLMDESDLSKFDKAYAEIDALPDEFILQHITPSNSLDDLNDILFDLQQQDTPEEHFTSTRELVTTHGNASASDLDAIDIPDVETDIGFCIDVSGPLAGSLNATYEVLSGIDKAAEYSCLQQALGESLSLVCTPLSIAAAVAEFAYREADFCRNEVRAAKGEAILQLERNIGAYLNTVVDQVPLSSRSTQTSVDQVTTDVIAADESIDSAQQSVDNNFMLVSNDIESALARLDQLSINLTNLIAESNDIQFRTQVNQVNVEDIQIRIADLQASSSEIREDTENLIATMLSLQSSANDLTTDIEDGFATVNRDDIASALSNSSFVIPLLATPAVEGGQLEEAREVVIEAITIVDTLGAGDTGAALSLLVQGDQAYNNQTYLTAYTFFAEAYRSLTTTKLLEVLRGIQ